jgi:hypothetical protein
MQKIEPLLNHDPAEVIFKMLHQDQPCIGCGSAILLFSQKICSDPAKTFAHNLSHADFLKYE